MPSRWLQAKQLKLKTQRANAPYRFELTAFERQQLENDVVVLARRATTRVSRHAAGDAKHSRLAPTAGVVPGTVARANEDWDGVSKPPTWQFGEPYDMSRLTRRGEVIETREGAWPDKPPLRRR